METPTVPKPVDSPHGSEHAVDPVPSVAPQPDYPASGHVATGPMAEVAPPPYQPRPYAPYPTAPMPPRNNIPWIVGGVVAAFLLIGLVAALVVALVAGLALGGVGVGMMRTSVSSQTYHVQGTPTVIVNNSVGNVHFTAGDDSTVTVQTTKHARAVDAASAQRAFDSMSTTVTQQGNTLTITSNFSSAWMSGMMQGRSVDYLITLPADSIVRADVSAGTIDVARTTGALTLTTSAGNITVNQATFDSGSLLRTSAGNVDASGILAPGASLEIRVSTGNATLALPASTATHLTADVSVGNLTIAGFPVSPSNTGFTRHHASGDTGPNAKGSVSVTVSTGNATITAR